LRALLLVVLLSGCEAPPIELDAALRGAELFEDPRLSPSEFNVFSCATCHTISPESPTASPSDRGAIASNLYGVTERPRWFGGQLISLYEAVDFCYVYFMRGFPSLDPNSIEARLIYEYLENQSDGRVRETRPMTVVEQITDPGPGDSAAGEAVWAESCAPCHGEAFTGKGRLGPTISVVPEASLEFARDNNVPVRLVIAEKVRHGQFFGVGGNMPFYPLERLSDEQLSDLLEFLAP
jgi:thiosulfate dehydrogenase